MNTSRFIKEINVIDPDSNAEVTIAIYKHNESGGMFAIDSSYIDQVIDDEYPTIPDPFNEGKVVELS